MTHDRHLIDRVSTAILALDGRGGVSRFSDYGQWEANAGTRAFSTKESAPPESVRPTKTPSKKLSYLEQREWEGIEEAVSAAEARMEAARAHAEDPSIASDAEALQRRLAELDSAKLEVDRLYGRWAELEAKRK